MAFPEKKYVSLEEPDLRQYAQQDPHGFLAGCRDGAILDEIQQVPELLSYIQDSAAPATAEAGVSAVDPVLIYGGDQRQQRQSGLVLPWHAVCGFGWASQT